MLGLPIAVESEHERRPHRFGEEPAPWRRLAPWFRRGTTAQHPTSSGSPSSAERPRLYATAAARRGALGLVVAATGQRVVVHLKWSARDSPFGGPARAFLATGASIQRLGGGVGRDASFAVRHQVVERGSRARHSRDRGLHRLDRGSLRRVDGSNRVGGGSHCPGAHCPGAHRVRCRVAPDRERCFAVHGRATFDRPDCDGSG